MSLLSFEQIREKSQELQQQGHKIVATNGCFDVLHIGHTRYLTASKAQGDILILGLNSDASVRAIKGETRPINNEQDRAELLLALESVDYVVIFSEETACEFLKAAQANIYTKGGDYRAEELQKWPEYAVAQELGMDISLIDFVEGKSSTKIIEAIKG